MGNPIKRIVRTTMQLFVAWEFPEIRAQFSFPLKTLSTPVAQLKRFREVLAGMVELAKVGVRTA